MGQLGEDRVLEQGREGVHRRAWVGGRGGRGLRRREHARELRVRRTEEVVLVRRRDAVGRGHRLQ